MMAHTYTSFLYHLVYSTKERRSWLCPELLERLVSFTGGIIRERGGKLLAMNGTENHVHLLAVLVPKLAMSDQVRDVKALTSGWIKDTLPNLGAFGWQNGYGGFSVG